MFSFVRAVHALNDLAAQLIECYTSGLHAHPVVQTQGTKWGVKLQLRLLAYDSIL